jgi:hypothetical protein
MEGGGGTCGTSASHDGGTVYISLPNAASGGGATPLPGIDASAGPIFLPDASAGDAPTPLLGAAVGDGGTPLPGAAEGGAPTPTLLLLWLAATGLEVWRLFSRSNSLRFIAV